jgi:GTPase
VSGGQQRQESIAREAAVLVGLQLPGDPVLFEPPLSELARLAETAGAEVIHKTVQKRRAPQPATLVGKGKALEVKETADALDADVVIFDRDLSPAQQRNLEKIVERKVLDRSEVILDIFAARARTRQARVQVELAKLEYMRPRLRRMWTHLSRIEGGIGMRGPGEKQIELDRRLVHRRIGALKSELKDIELQHHTRASSRSDFFTVSLVGYTNAGKSTLLRRLTGEETLIEDRLFATLDTTTRAWELPGGKRVFLSDTVGFIRGLPHHLVASFHATLEETRDADLLLHVVDASNPDAASQVETVVKVLNDVGAGDIRTITLLNKVDRLDDRLALELARPRNGRSLATSAVTGEGIEELQSAVSEEIASLLVEVEFSTHPGNGKLLAFVAEKGEVVSRDYVGDDEVRVVARLPKRYANALVEQGAKVRGF